MLSYHMLFVLTMDLSQVIFLRNVTNMSQVSRILVTFLMLLIQMSNILTTNERRLKSLVSGTMNQRKRQV